jgi:histidyl-tRNA synthetase
MELQTAKGVQDIVPEEKILMNKVVDTLKGAFERYGFAPLETPIIERYETLAAKFAAGEDSDALKETFKLTDQGGRALGLRFDLTVPLSRFVAMNPNLKMPFKRYEIGQVFRDGPIKAGRVRQLWQCDVDTIGSRSMLADAEIIAVAEEGFNKLGMDVVIKVNNRKLLNGILTEVGIADRTEALIVIDKLDKIGEEGVKKELREKGIKEEQAAKLFKLIKKGISLAQIKSSVKNEEAALGVKELEELFGYTKAMGLKKVEFEVSLARGLAYYTGTVFEAYLKKGKITSAVAGGGRYDEMIGNFLGGSREIPAVGISFGLVPILETLKEKESGKTMKKTTVKAYVVPINTVKESLKVVQELRKEAEADIDLNNRGVSKNLQYASAMGIPYVLLIGEEEVKQGKVMMRDMESGEQKLVTVKEASKKIGRGS